MKELQKLNSEQTEIHALKPVNKEKKLIGQLRPHPGQKVWQMNLKTRVIEEAEYTVWHIVGGGTKRELIVGEGCIYCCAINVRNADKQFFKMLGLKYPKNIKPKLQ